MANNLMNSCCDLWKARYTKLEQKRHALRQGVEILKAQIDRLQQENVNLKTAYGEERSRGNVVEEEKRKEASLRISMEKEITKLKSEISSIKPEVVSGNEDLDKEITLLRACISEREVEIHRLKRRLVEEERKAAELQEALENEKKRADEASKIVNTAGKKAEKIINFQLETLKNEFEKTRLKCEEMNKTLDAEKQKAIGEKKRADEEKARADANEKMFLEEKCHANVLVLQLEEEKQKVENLRKEVQEVVSSQRTVDSHELDNLKRSLETAKKVVREKKCAHNTEMSKKEELIKKATEEKCLGDELFQELQRSKQRTETIEKQLHEANDMLEAERKKASSGEMHANGEKLKSEKQGRTVIENGKRDMEEKPRADRLLKELENDRQKLQHLMNELHELKLNEQTAKVSHLHKQWKFEKKRVKHAKEVAKLEKAHNNTLQRELCRLRQDFKCLLQNMDMLSDTYGVRNHAKKPGLPNVQSGQLSRRISPSGMETDLLLEGFHGEETLPRSSLNTNTASFSDEQLMGSQERVACCCSTSTVLAVDNTNLKEPINECSDEYCKWNDNEKVGPVAENSIRSPVQTATGHAEKRKKIIVEFESLKKSCHSEGKRIFQKAEDKMSALHGLLFQGNSCGNYDRCCKKRKASCGPGENFRQVDDSNVPMEVGKLGSLAVTSTKTMEKSQAPHDPDRDNQDTGISFELVMNGNYMERLNLDNVIEEGCFRKAMERPLSPTIPEIDLHNDETRVDSQMLSVPTFASNGAGDRHGCSTHNNYQVYCITFSDVKDIGSITRIFCSIKNCLARCCLFPQTKWLVQDILSAHVLEKDLRSREKVCVLFSLILLNFSGVSSSKCEDFRNEEVMDSFSAHVRSVLSDPEMNSHFAEICNFSELLGLIEDFVLSRRIFSQNNVAAELLDGSSSSFEILHEGKKNVLCPKMASTNLVVAGGVILASICRAIGQIGSICEVSFNILRMCRAERSLVLIILHIFAYICGEEYFTINNYCLVMKVVKSVVTFIEGVSTNNTEMDLQPGDNIQPQFSPCVRCRFSEGSISFDDFSSMLLQELQSYCTRYDVPHDLAHSLNTASPSCNLGDILSSLELSASIMGWDWTCNKIVSKLFEMLESCDQGMIFSTALVALLGELGRVGVETCGYDDNGVKSIKCQLLDILYRGATSKCSTPFAMSIISALVGLYPKGNEVFFESNVKLSSKSEHSTFVDSDILKNCLSSLSSEQISSLFGIKNPVTAV